MKPDIKFWSGIVFSAATLVLAVRAANINETWSALTQTDYVPILPALVALGLTLAGKAVRWRLLFAPRHDHLPLNKVFSVLIIGQMINFLLPFRIGEVARAYFLGESTGINKPLALATIVVEKVVEMLAALALSIILLLIIPFPEWVGRPLLSLAVVATVLLLVLLFLAYQRGPLTRVAARLSDALPSAFRPAFLREQAERTLEGLEALRHPRTMLAVAALTCITWVLAALTNHFVFLAVGLNLPLAASAFLLVILQVGVAVPAGPGRIGVFQYLTILALAVFAVAPERALAAGIVLYLLVYIPPVILGLFFLGQYHVGMWRLRALAGK